MTVATILELMVLAGILCGVFIRYTPTLTRLLELPSGWFSVPSSRRTYFSREFFAVLATGASILGYFVLRNQSGIPTLIPTALVALAVFTSLVALFYEQRYFVFPEGLRTSVKENGPVYRWEDLCDCLVRTNGKERTIRLFFLRRTEQYEKHLESVDLIFSSRHASFFEKRLLLLLEERFPALLNADGQKELNSIFG
jgi:hypothetical protein